MCPSNTPKPPSANPAAPLTLFHAPLQSEIPRGYCMPVGKPKMMLPQRQQVVLRIVLAPRAYWLWPCSLLPKAPSPRAHAYNSRVAEGCVLSPGAGPDHRNHREPGDAPHRAGPARNPARRMALYIADGSPNPALESNPGALGTAEFAWVDLFTFSPLTYILAVPGLGNLPANTERERSTASPPRTNGSHCTTTVCFRRQAKVRERR